MRNEKVMEGRSDRNEKSNEGEQNEVGVGVGEKDRKNRFLIAEHGQLNRTLRSREVG